VVATIILELFQSFFYDVTLNKVNGFWDKINKKRFLKKLEKKIGKFCSDNESTYIDSGAFATFLRRNKPIERIMNNAIANEETVDINQLIKKLIREAQNVAEKSEMKLSCNDISMITDLCKLIDSNMNYYYYNKLSSEQRYIVSRSSRETEKLRNDIYQISQGQKEQIEQVKKIVLETASLSDYRAKPIAELICKKMWSGQFAEIKDLLPLVATKSKDIELVVDIINNVMKKCDGEISKQEDLIGQINNNFIRDCVIRNILPLAYFRNLDVKALSELTENETLKNIISSVKENDFSYIFSEKIVHKNGIEKHIYELNKRLLAEEKWLIDQILIIYLYKQSGYSINIIEEKAGESESWLSTLLFWEKKIEAILYEDISEYNKERISEIEEKMLLGKELYRELADDIKEIYYSLILKTSILMQDGNDEIIEKEIPEKLKEKKKIKESLIVNKIAKNQIDFSELYAYCNSISEYWLLINYIVNKEKSDEIVKIISKHIELIEKLPAIFFIYTGSLLDLEKQDEVVVLLNKYKEYYSGYYDYWDIYLSVDKSEDIKCSFIEKSRKNELRFFNRQSEYSIVERLLFFKQYELAKMYIRRLEVQQGETSRIIKYKAFIMCGYNKNIDALELFKKIFPENSTNEQVIDKIITLSLLMKRKVDSKYIEAANNLRTPRMYLLAAEGYASNGNIIDARRNNIKALLSWDDFRNPAFGQYLKFNIHNEERDNQNIEKVGRKTAVYLKEVSDKNEIVYCIHDDKILPECPYIWNGDKHVYIENAAKIGIYKKRKNDIVTIDEKKYKIVDIQSMDTYFARLCFENIVKSGAAKAITTEVVDGKLNVESFIEQFKEIVGDEKEKKDWLKEYNDINEIAYPLFSLKKFYNATYTQFIDAVLTEKIYFIREIPIHSEMKNDKFILTFAVLMILKKIGISTEFICEHNTYIPESMQLQIDNDVTKMIEEYSQDLVASMAVYDDKIVRNEASDEDKDKWLQESGKFKDFADNLNTILNVHNLNNQALDSIDLIGLFGIPDYDAISICENSEYALVSVEAIISSIKNTNDIDVNVVSITSWLIWCNIPVITLINYVYKLLKLGCLSAVTEEFIIFVIDNFEKENDEERRKILKQLDKLFMEYNLVCADFQEYAIQILNIVFSNVVKKVDNPAFNPIIRLLMYDLLKLQNLRMEYRIKENGGYELVTKAINRTEDEQ
jgi:hypothetical protein